MAETEDKSGISEKVANIKIHGFPNAYASSTWPRRLGWLFITGVAMAFCLLGIITTVMNYYTYPVVVGVTFKDEALSSFPAVTICNVNKERKSQKKSRWLFSNVKPNRDPEEERQVKGHQILDMLYYCQYKEMGCSASDFVLVNGSIGRYGNCYTFNSGFGEAVNVMNDHITGRRSALSLVLDSEQYEYTQITQATGFEIRLHDSGQFPTEDSKTLSIAPGFWTFVELSQSRLKRALKPYGDCEVISSERNKLLNIWSRFGYNYSVAACKYSQKQMMVINRCDCYYYELPAPQHLENTVKQCRSYSLCIMAAITEFSVVGSWSHICPYPCEESLYESTVSSHRWPSKALLDGRIPSWVPSRLTSLQDMRENLAKVSIYYDSSRIKTTEEVPLYANIFTLIGEIGGHLGLWVGVSLLAVCELFEIAYDLVCFGISLVP